jgi:hypothetical protein
MARWTDRPVSPWVARVRGRLVRYVDARRCRRWAWASPRRPGWHRCAAFRASAQPSRRSRKQDKLVRLSSRSLTREPFPDDLNTTLPSSS